MTKSAYRVIVSERAKRMLGEHIYFLSGMDKKAVAAKKAEIISALKSLSEMPQRYPFFEEEFIPANKYHKMFIPKWYVVIYQIVENTVYVDYILDCRQDYQWLI